MAIAFVAGNSTTDGGSLVTSITLTKPSGLASGNLLLAFVTAAGIGSQDTFTIPSGWTRIGANQFNSDSSGAAQISGAAFYKIANSTDAAAASFVFTCGTAAYLNGSIVAYSGTDTATPLNATAAEANQVNGTGGAFTAPAVTTTVANCQILILAATSYNPDIPITGTGLTQRTETTSAGVSGYGNAAILDRTTTTAGAYGTFALASAGTNNPTIAITAAIAPASGGGGTGGSYSPYWMLLSF